MYALWILKREEFHSRLLSWGQPFPFLFFKVLGFHWWRRFYLYYFVGISFIVSVYYGMERIILHLQGYRHYTASWLNFRGGELKLLSILKSYRFFLSRVPATLILWMIPFKKYIDQINITSSYSPGWLSSDLQGTFKDSFCLNLYFCNNCIICFFSLFYVYGLHIEALALCTIQISRIIIVISIIVSVLILF